MKGEGLKTEETPLGLECAANAGVISGVVEVWQSLDLADVFSDLRQGKELADKWGAGKGERRK